MLTDSDFIFATLNIGSTHFLIFSSISASCIKPKFCALISLLFIIKIINSIGNTRFIYNLMYSEIKIVFFFIKT